MPKLAKCLLRPRVQCAHVNRTCCLWVKVLIFFIIVITLSSSSTTTTTSSSSSTSGTRCCMSTAI
jgi:hypothetical protein